MNIMLILLLIYLIIGAPWLEKVEFSSFTERLGQGIKHARLDAQKQAFIGNWIQFAYLLALILFFKLPPGKLGISPIDFHAFGSLQFGYKALVIAVFVVYFVVFYLFPVILTHFSNDVRQSVVKSLESFKAVIPTNKREKFWWVMNSLSSSVEELVYRGFVFFFFLHYFPGINIFSLVAISLVLDAMRYISRPPAAIYMFFSSIFFIIGFLVFHSVIIAMVLHIIHDMRVLFMPIDDLVTVAN